MDEKKKKSIWSKVFSKIFLALFFAYGMCMGESWKSMEKLKEYEQKLIHFGLDHKDYNRILYFSLTTLLPTYFCVFLVSLVPLYTYEVWFITVFPCILLKIYLNKKVI